MLEKEAHCIRPFTFREYPGDEMMSLEAQHCLPEKVKFDSEQPAD